MQHRAPGGIRRLDPEAEEAERRLDQDRVADGSEAWTMIGDRQFGRMTPAG